MKGDFEDSSVCQSELTLINSMIKHIQQSAGEVFKKKKKIELVR